MATTTPNYGWAVPTSTDLVKDGATAIETLGDSIDASMFTALGTKKAGMVLLSTQTFSAASTVSFAANTFSASFNTYLFTFDLTGSTAIDLLARLRAAGTDNTSANYNRQYFYGDTTPNSASATGATSWNLGQLYDSDSKRAVLDFFIQDVQVSGRYTSGRADGVSNVNGSPYALRSLYGTTVTTSYDSITFLTSSGTITGSISCYGYAQ
jgi:hypothetical protein